MCVIETDFNKRFYKALRCIQWGVRRISREVAEERFDSASSIKVITSSKNTSSR